MSLENLFSRNILGLDENQLISGNYSIVLSKFIQNKIISSSSNILIRQVLIGASIDYSIDNGINWIPISFGNYPIQIINTGNIIIVVKLTTDITFNTQTSNPPGPGANGFFIIGSDNITFDGNNKTVTINNLSNYLGFIQNGTITNNGYSNITIQNLSVKLSGNSTLGLGCGLITQAYFSKGSINNIITNCYSTSDILVNSTGAICGQYAAIQNGNLTINKCYSTGVISGGFAGGICGEYAAFNNGNVIIKNCYSNGNILNSTAGGICGANAGFNNGIVTITNCFSTGIESASNGIFGDNKQITATQIYCYSANGSWNDSKARKSLENLVPVPNNPIGTIWADSNSNKLNVPYIFASFGTSPYLIPSAILNVGETSQTANITSGVVYSIIAIAKNSLPPNRPSGYPFIQINNQTGAITVTKNNLPSSGNYTIYIYQNFLNGVYTTSTFNLTISPIPNSTISYRTLNVSAVTCINTPVEIKLKTIPTIPTIFIDKTKFVIKTEPKNGKAILVNNIVEYIPNKNYTGSDSFTYYSSYYNINSNISTVNIIIDKCKKIENCDYFNSINIYKNVI